MAYFDMDDVYVVLSDEALATADKICGDLSIPTNSPLFDTLVIECGRAFKPFLEHDHEMGLNARQKLLRGMIERTPVGSAHFEMISQDFIKDIEFKDPALFGVLQALEKNQELQTKTLAHKFYQRSQFDPLFLYGSWVDPNKSLLHLNVLQTAMENLMYIFRCSLTERLSDIYKVHRTSAKLTAEEQKKAVFDTLHDKKPEEAQLFLWGMKHLQQTHPQLTETLLKRFYYMNIEKDEYNTVFDPAHVLTSDQIDALENMTANLNAYWKQYPIAQMFAHKWANDVAARALHIMDGIGHTDELVVAVSVEAVGKDKIEERRTNTAETLRMRMTP